MKRWHRKVQEVYMVQSNNITASRFIKECIGSLGIACSYTGSEVLTCYNSGANRDVYKIDTLQAPDFSEKERFLAWAINQLEQLQECLGVRTTIKEISSEVRGKRI